MELMNGLLFSLPGTPVLYYGDEIGMGDNVYLGDRNGVRTPMQWNMDRNAGFSMANPQRLILPVVIDPEYHYESLNVENQQQNPSSFLWWTKRLIALRKRFMAFGRGTIEFLTPSNSRVLAFVRQWGKERVLVVANLSRFVQYVELDLSRFEGATPVELFGKTRFRTVRGEPYVMTLGPHGFYWLSLEEPAAQPERLSTPRLPASTFECTSVETLLRDPEIEGALASFLEGRPWFRGHHRAATSASVVDVVCLGSDNARIFVTLVRVDYADGDPETYVLPLFLSPAGKTAVGAVLAEVDVKVQGGEADHGVLIDALEDPVAARALLRALAGAAQSKGAGALTVTAPSGLAPTEADLRPDARRAGSESFDTTLVYGDRFVLQLFRRLEAGVSPELELGRFLASRGSDLAPRLEASVELSLPRATPETVAVVHAFVPDVETCWEHTQLELGRYYDRTLARPREDLPPPPDGHLLDLAQREPPPLVAQMIGGYLDTAARLARRVAELHLLLAAGDGPAFAPEPYAALDRRSKYQSLRNLSGNVLRRLRERQPMLAPRAKREAEAVLAQEAEILKRFEPLLRLKTNATRIRVHGDLHLGHVLYTGKDFIVTGIGGNRTMGHSARVRKRSPLRDIAGMVRSFDFAAIKFLLDPARVRESDVDAARPWALHWTSWVSASFLRGYLGATAGASFVPSEREPLATLFDAFVLERALYQLELQLEDREATAVAVPLMGISHILAAPRARSDSTLR
jgi:maltose alpha-D-glucosyltransferase/alpha-amylase